jgi:DNA (cytosine-5)-methyltransferase 1
MPEDVPRPSNKHAWLLKDLLHIPSNGVKVFSTFSCGGGSCLGYKRAGCQVIAGNDIDSEMTRHYKENLKPLHFFECSVAKLVEKRNDQYVMDLMPELYDCDILDWSPPCFPSGTKVTTSNGDVNIQDIKTGDKVLTHNGLYKAVNDVFISDFNGHLITIGMKFGRSPVTSTPNHPFYVRRRLKNAWPFVKGADSKRFGEPEWVQAKDIKTGDLVLEPNIKDNINLPDLFVNDIQVINTKGGGHNKGEIHENSRELRISPLDVQYKSDEIAYFFGMYLAEGHRRGYEPNSIEDVGPFRREVILSIHEKEVPDISKLVAACGYNPQVQKHGDEHCYRITVTDKHLWKICGEFGDGAENKNIPTWVWSMPLAWKTALLSGYLYGDGNVSVNNGNVHAGLRNLANTVSRELAIGVARLVPEVIGVAASWKLIRKAGKYKIQGREVNCRDTFSIEYRPVGRGSRFRLYRITEAGVWFPVTSVTTNPAAKTTVYNLSVIDEHTYVAGGVAVHNCSSYTLSGNREGDWGKNKKFREGQSEQVLDDLFFEFLELVNRLKPKTVIAENVPGMLMGNAKGYVKLIYQKFEQLGYNCQLFKVNAADCGVPQARNRVFFLAVRRDWAEKNNLGRIKLDTDRFKCKHISTSEACSDLQVLTPEEKLDPGVKTSQFDVKWWHLTRPGENYAKPRKRAGVKNGLWNWSKLPAHKPATTLISESQCIRHWAEPRGLTLREFIRLGSFPDDYKAESFDRGKYIIGMSVPPLMAEAVARAVCEQWLMVRS